MLAKEILSVLEKGFPYFELFPTTSAFGAKPAHHLYAKLPPDSDISHLPFLPFSPPQQEQLRLYLLLPLV